MATTDSLNPTTDDFAAMLDETFTGDSALEGTVVKGRIIAVENDLAIIDVGLKTEGRVPLREFHTPGSDTALAAGDEVEVYLE
ncbi:MAG: S1 RNA-binding domain-containing protein, partial [Aestuariivirgaceae bacterium]